MRVSSLLSEGRQHHVDVPNLKLKGSMSEGPTGNRLCGIVRGKQNGLNGIRNVWYFGARCDSKRKVDNKVVLFNSCWLGKNKEKIKRK